MTSRWPSIRSRTATYHRNGWGTVGRWFPALFVAWLTIASVPSFRIHACGQTDRPQAPAGSDSSESYQAINQVPLASVGKVIIPEALAEHLMQASGITDQNLDSLSDAERTALWTATGVVLLKRELALHALEAKDGERLRVITSRTLERLDAVHQQTKTSVREVAAKQGLDPELFRRVLAWEVAWSDYLKQHLTEENADKWFKKNRWRYDGTRIQIEQLFWPVDPSDPDALASATNQAQAVTQDVQAGKTTFREQIAQRQLDDDESVAQGWIDAAGQLPPAIVRPVFELPIGQPSPPLESPIGVHVIVVTDRKEGDPDRRLMKHPEHLRRDMADFLLDRLAREGAKQYKATWLSRTLPPPKLDGIDLAVRSSEAENALENQESKP
jgi:hypothetical protein